MATITYQGGNGTSEVTVIYGDQSITVSGIAPITLTDEDFRFL
jgi:hypothetical protein